MSSGFISETEIEIIKKRRQEEWERVRKDDDPIEAPPQEATKCLYDQLKEQKDKKEADYHEAKQLKNLVKVLDDDEVDFLDFVDRAKLEEEKRKRQEEAQELTSFRNELSKLREQELEKHIQHEIGLKDGNKTKATAKDGISIGTSRNSQTKLLAGVVKRKTISVSSDGDKEASAEPANKLLKTDVSSVTNSSSTLTDDNRESSEKCRPSNNSKQNIPYEDKIASIPCPGSLVCIGILPGLESYSDSNSSDDDDILASVEKDSSESDDEPGGPARDLCGRKIIEVDKHDNK